MGTERLRRSIAIIWLLLSGVAIAQTTPTNAPQKAANAWMLTPTPYLEWNKNVSPEIRAERDNYMDYGTPPVLTSSQPPQRLPLTSPGPHEYVTPSGCDGAASGPEIQHHPNRAVVAGTFTSHRSTLSASAFSLYSEITLNVAQVFENRTGSQHLAPHQDITIVINGGTVTLRSGRTLSYDTQPRTDSLQPAHTYLVVLSYHPEGDFYSYHNTWDISDGMTQPIDCRSKYWARSGRSSLSGLSSWQLGPALSKLLVQSQ